MMASYKTVYIIFNPNSTGPSKSQAQKLAKQLRRAKPGYPVHIIPTEYPGHAEGVAYELAQASPGALIISSSGDGGYNEVVNGAMKAQAEGYRISTGLLAAGNANDHYKYLHKHDTAEQIIKGRAHKIDLLQINTLNKGTMWTRYAHSYIGIGLTPTVGNELNKASLNPFNEKWIALKSFIALKPVTIKVRGKIRTYDSVVFANIGRMSKVLSLSDTASVTDGKFELITFAHQKRRKLLLHLFQAATKGLQTTNRRTEYDFKTIDPINIQLDGEVTTIPANTRVHITIAPKALACIV